MQYFFIFFSLVATVAARSCNYYCNNPCTDDKNNLIKHIGCKNNRLFDKERCPPNAKLVNMTSDMKSYVTETHNLVRNLVAGGKIPFSIACRMPAMQWDDELAYLASLHVKQCEENYDKCHNTGNFQYSGQNLYIFYDRDIADFDFNEMFQQAITEWNQLGMNITQAITDSYWNVYQTSQLGKFLIIIAELNTHVGCAAATYTIDDLSYFLLACNYATSLFEGKPVYTTCNKPGQECETGKHLKYPNLCSENSYRLSLFNRFNYVSHHR